MLLAAQSMPRAYENFYALLGTYSGKLSTPVPVENAADSSPADKKIEHVGNGKATKAELADSVRSRSRSPFPRRNQNSRSKSQNRSPVRDLGNQSRSPFREKLAEKAVEKKS